MERETDAAVKRGGIAAFARAGAVLALIVAMGASAMLGLSHLEGVALPGCGAGSGCSRAAASVYGKVPGLGWPTAYLGLAYFAAMLAAVLALRGGVAGKGLMWVVRLAGVASLGFLIVSVVEDLLCLYCVTVQGANLAFVFAMHGAPEKSASGAAAAKRVGASWIGACVFVLVTGVLVIVEQSTRRTAMARDEAALTRSTERIVSEAGGGRTSGENGDREAGPNNAEGSLAAARGFSVRHRIGPERAPIRLVVISDYQCPDCRAFERQVEEVLSSRGDVSFVMKHFPFCTDCNPGAPTNLHPNACWAARAAETAGLLRGAEGFAAMHRWLFSRAGAFTESELKAALPGLGFDAAEFKRVMQTDAMMGAVKADIAEANSVGILMTPMVFINGVELKGWRAPDALKRAVAALAVTNPAADTGERDLPPTAMERTLAEWRAQPVRELAVSENPRVLGPAESKVTVVLWGDYEEPFTIEADGIVRRAVSERGDVRYEFRHFPFNTECNPAVPRTQHPHACRMAKVAEVAAALGAGPVFWTMHEWLMGQGAGFSEAGLAAHLAAMKVDSAAVVRGVNAAGTKITEDCRAAQQLGVTSIPFIFIDGRLVPRWKLADGEVLSRMIEEAARD